jgi:hypothetical protein
MMISPGIRQNTRPDMRVIPAAAVLIAASFGFAATSEAAPKSHSVRLCCYYNKPPFRFNSCAASPFWNNIPGRECHCHVEGRWYRGIIRVCGIR